jgi:hypothetical protein
MVQRATKSVPERVPFRKRLGDWIGSIAVGVILLFIVQWVGELFHNRYGAIQVKLGVYSNRDVGVFPKKCGTPGVYVVYDKDDYAEVSLALERSAKKDARWIRTLVDSGKCLRLDRPTLVSVIGSSVLRGHVDIRIIDGQFTGTRGVVDSRCIAPALVNRPGQESP